MRRKTRDEKLTKVGVLAFAEQLPEVGVWKRRESGYLEFQEVILVGVEIDGVDTCRRGECVGQDVVTSGRDGKNNILGSEFEKTLIDTSIFPSEGVDVLILELEMLLQLIIIVDSPVVILIEERRQRKIGREIDYRGFKSLGAKFRTAFLDSTRESTRMVNRREVW